MKTKALRTFGGARRKDKPQSQPLPHPLDQLYAPARAISIEDAASRDMRATMNQFLLLRVVVVLLVLGYVPYRKRV